MPPSHHALAIVPAWERQALHRNRARPPGEARFEIGGRAFARGLRQDCGVGEDSRGGPTEHDANGRLGQRGTGPSAHERHEDLLNVTSRTHDTVRAVWCLSGFDMSVADIDLE